MEYSGQGPPTHMWPTVLGLPQRPAQALTDLNQGGKPGAATRTGKLRTRAVVASDIAVEELACVLVDTALLRRPSASRGVLDAVSRRIARITAPARVENRTSASASGWLRSLPSEPT